MSMAVTCKICGEVYVAGVEADRCPHPEKPKDLEPSPEAGSGRCHLTMTQAQFNAMLEYSCSLPSGTTLGKRWRRKKDYYDASKGWLIGEYVPDPDPKMIGIKWYEVTISDAPKAARARIVELEGK